MEDKLVWENDSTGSYTARAGYHHVTGVLFFPDNKMHWDHAWKLITPQKVKFFILLGEWRKILTNEEWFK